MVVLKKLKGSTLMETLIATVLIVVIFMLASMILNNLFYTSIKSSKKDVSRYLNELQYLQQNQALQLPYYETYKNWNISIEKLPENNHDIVEIEAVNPKTKKSILIKSYVHK